VQSKALKDIQKTLDTLVVDIIPDGQLHWAKRIEKEVDGIDIDINTKWPVLDYKQDETYLLLLEALNDRRELLDQAFAAKYEIVSCGEVIPVVGVKSSIQASIKLSRK